MTPGGDTWSGTNLHGFNAGQWHHVAWRWRRVPGRDHDVFTDGVLRAPNFEDNSANWTVDAVIDDWYYGGIVDRNDRWFDGSVDEIRVSNVFRSDAWIATEFNNQSSPGTFYVLGPQAEGVLDIVKLAFWLDGTPIPSGATIPGGVEFKYLLYINNPGAALSDVSVQDVLDSSFVYQPGTIQVDNSVAECAAESCTALEEQAIFSAVSGSGFLSDGVDGDIASYTGASLRVDAGDSVVANDPLTISSDAVWAILFSVNMP